MLNSSMKSRSSSLKSFILRTYANPAPQTLSFQHYVNSLYLFILKALQLRSFNTYKTPFSNSSPINTYKKQGRGWG